ncbi:MAG TPA: hypothetical protein PKY30_19675 [Myxococcota bacterium]|nr:hypothetical protein [Myxococcota bacterium]HND34326.1 hypothetical protein [Myxococcota bacterium]HNH49276.1 hypothetical protein [Myxococcota bacterium]
MDATMTAYTVTTFLVMAQRAGFSVDSPEFVALAKRIGGEDSGEALGQELVAVVQGYIGDGSPDAVIAGLKALLGAAVTADANYGDHRDARLAGIRRTLFGRSTPWLAWVLERSPEGTLHSTCLLVEDFADKVVVMDPNPFNDIDESRRYSISEFLAIWELAGCRSLSIH